ncbi:LOW QUALITY PROTEIN: ATP-binding cassette (ABC) Superfamily [Phytophthora palmivora]|uniref:ATP-binding cassette (ABC) Superfamily n=1 Tax=Phytophthora palmivora TaxID=4796 RepID=A0A2P4WZJ8_9STRA|nr:LOW QUALITY PROTEIN: ATP-binding cassette (ABC) Superfamily [Phytophthora palmivora]
MFLEHLIAPRGLNYFSPIVCDVLFVNNIKAARYVLLGPHRIPLKKFTSRRKKPEDRGGLFPEWVSLAPDSTTTQSQAEDLFWRCVCLKDVTVQELKELPDDRLLPYVLDQRVLNQRDLRIAFAHLVAKRPSWRDLDSSLYPALKMSAGTVHRKAAKKPRTTYAPAVDPKSQQPSGSQPGAGLPAPTSSVTRGNPATTQAAGASLSAAAPGRPAPHGSGARRSDQGGQEELSHAYEYEAPSQPYPSGPSTSGRDSVGSLLSDEVRQLRDRVYAIEIALGLGPGGQAASQAASRGPLRSFVRIWTLLVVRLMSSTGALTAELRP